MAGKEEQVHCNGRERGLLIGINRTTTTRTTHDVATGAAVISVVSSVIITRGVTCENTSCAVVTTASIGIGTV